MGGARLGSCIVPQAFPTVKSVSVDQSLPTVDPVAQNQCVELGAVTDKGHCCVKGELNVGLGIAYHTTGLLGAETDPCQEWGLSSVCYLCLLCVHRENEANRGIIKLLEVGGNKKVICSSQAGYYTSWGFDFSGKTKQELHSSTNLEARTCMSLTQGSRAHNMPLFLAPE